jgi:putative aldouronate transport system substrate-binding protein
MKRTNFICSCLVLVILITVIPGTVFASGQSSAAKAGLTEVSVFCMWSQGKAAWDDIPWFRDYLRDNLGIALTFKESPGGNHEQFLTTQVAANDMADIFAFREPNVIANVIGSGRMLNLNNHKDKLPAIYNQAVLDNARDYMIETYGGSEKGLYAMPIRVGSNIRVDYNNTLRYDIWKQIGSPAIPTFEDMLPVLKRMQDAYPVNAEGQKVYGFALWSEWDKVGIAPLTYMARSLGYDIEYASNAVAIYVDGSRSLLSITDPAGPYYRALKICFQANQMGLLDPDSLTHRYDAMTAKDAAGRYLYHTVFWADGFTGDRPVAGGPANGENGIGFAPVVRGDSKGIAYADYPIGESQNVWGIPANTKVRDKALEFYNFWQSYEGLDIMSNGPRGMIWDIGSDGLRYVTPKGWDILEMRDPTTVFVTPNGSAGGILGEGGLSAGLLNPATNFKQPISFSSWDTSIERANSLNKLLKIWQADHNTSNLDYDRWQTANGYSVKENSGIRAMPAMPLEIENMTNLIADVVKTASWQAIYASSEAEFDRIWQDCITRADGLGMQQVLQWTIGAWNQAKAIGDKYKLPDGYYVSY